MFSKNLRYYRLKNSMSRAELAKQSGLTPMAITNYENGTRNPSMEVLKSLANVLGVKISDFLAVRNENIVFSHGEFRKVSTMSQAKQVYVREVVEEYFARFYTAVELLGGEVLPDPPECHALPITGDVEEDARAMRRHLGIAEEGPIKDLITILENKGILVYVCEIESSKFSGMNGLVNDRPYIIVNGSMTPERNRSTIAHGRKGDRRHCDCYQWCFPFPQGRCDSRARCSSWPCNQRYDFSLPRVRNFHASSGYAGTTDWDHY